MLTILAYLAGIAFHVIFKWSEWKAAAPKPSKWMGYWADNAAPNIGSAVCAVVVLGIWQSGLTSLLGIEGLADQLPDTPLVMVFCGYVSDSVARNVLKRFQAK